MPQNQNNNERDFSSIDNPERFQYPRSVVFCVLVLLVCILGISGWQLSSRLRIDLPKLGTGIESAKDFGKTILDQQDEQLRQQDSDEDTVTDYDELRVYGTSPFIADTDSDGKTDAQEISDGTDPNCPVGKTCFGSQQLVDIQNPIQVGGFATPELKAVLNDPKKLRQLLLDGGADPLVVNNLDDQTIQLLAQEALDASTQITPEKLKLLESLTPNQIRNLLKSMGMPESELSKLTDEEITAIYKQALSQQAAGSSQ